MKHKYKPSLWWLALVPVLLIGGVGGGTTIFLKQAFRESLSKTFKAPASKTIEITESGTYNLLHNYQTVFRGKSYNLEPKLPEEAEILLVGPQGEVALDTSVNFNSSFNDNLSHGVGRYEITAPGKYTISVTGLESPHVITFSQAVIMRIVITTILSIILNLVGWFGAPAVAIVVFAGRLKDKRRFKAQHPELFKKEEPLQG